jgi:hypothetical protein
MDAHDGEHARFDCALERRPVQLHLRPLVDDLGRGVAVPRPELLVAGDETLLVIVEVVFDICDDALALDSPDDRLHQLVAQVRVLPRQVLKAATGVPNSSGSHE